MKGKRFISPGNWFAMTYPSDWNEFIDSDDDFLFYNADVWSGNFRISAYRMKGSSTLGEGACQGELDSNSDATEVTVGNYRCAYSKEFLEDNGEHYVCHVWVFGEGETALECSFTAKEEMDEEVAEAIIASVEIRHEDEKYPSEVIPVRLAEIEAIDEAYEWTTNLVKNALTVDFQGRADDLENLQKAIDKSALSDEKREPWLNVGITIGCILVNEIEDIEWHTLIDGNREAPVLLYHDTTLIDPMKLSWSKVKRGEPFSVASAYEEAVALLSGGSDE
jgi:hypothetical protein